MSPEWEDYYEDAQKQAVIAALGDEPKLEWKQYKDTFDLAEDARKHFDEKAGAFDWVSYYVDK